ncbi:MULTISPECIES: helix-turn-helix transcriptional regulator [unclassified Crossiella]|uniref:PadR family transcriptional regulator n=1 Tax=unclassified Crossiella TaxID=2620835 RepID=UPI0020000065|nr:MULTISPECIES: helix-turn-helix transcriptional regulator [unclassified Crossiella]MCK2244418.1 helix-turn-helix transcriptional regulator [Crossiella sp. S99.2]MCK2257754.1 helix-turn-helix transcriptional regulator [Crossiella sp. S99.1]
MAGAELTAGWLRGTLELAVAAVLAEADLHGYALVQRLAEQGLGTIKGGALYPVLGRMEAAGLVEAEWVAGQGGPGRKTYRLTPAGRDRLDEEIGHWRDFSAAMDRLVRTVRKDRT